MSSISTLTSAIGAAARAQQEKLDQEAALEIQKQQAALLLQQQEQAALAREQETKALSHGPAVILNVGGAA